jgi:hypothetical protein
MFLSLSLQTNEGFRPFQASSFEKAKESEIVKKKKKKKKK